MLIHVYHLGEKKVCCLVYNHLVIVPGHVREIYFLASCLEDDRNKRWLE